jgi:hypothetical protein
MGYIPGISACTAPRLCSDTGAPGGLSCFVQFQVLAMDTVFVPFAMVHLRCRTRTKLALTFATWK